MTASVTRLLLGEASSPSWPDICKAQVDPMMFMLLLRVDDVGSVTFFGHQATIVTLFPDASFNNMLALS